MSPATLNCRAIATDYDGTLAHNGYVSEETLLSLRRLKASGRRLILVTGREMAELKSVFPDYGIFDAIVAENGGLVVWPADDMENVLGEPVPESFLKEILLRGVAPFSVGRVVFATWRPHETTVLQIIQDLGIEYHIIFNKGAVMVLPSGINKATGLAHVLSRLEISPEHVAAIGDAENDHAFLDSCAISVAVENAIPALKAHCDLVMSKDHGAGVVELIERILADDLQGLGLRRPRQQMAQLRNQSS
jgi:hydroxymethylpyrimidine pyrophosphatase-like HAD family hydrolase